MEAEVILASKMHMKELKAIKPYDYFMLRPEAYDVKKGEQLKEKVAPT